VRSGPYRFRLFRISLLLLFLPLSSACPQELVPFDNEGEVYFITAAFEEESRFLGVDGLHDARIIATADSALSLIVTIRDSAGYRMEHRPLTMEDMTILRTRYAVIAREMMIDLETSVTKSRDEQRDGSSLFQQSFSGLGLSWYGLTIPAVVERGSASIAIGTYLLTAGGCYFFADGYAESHDISYNGAQAFQYFATRGIAHGYALAGIAMGNDLNHRIAVPLATGVSIAEGFAAMSMLSGSEWSEGRMGALSTFGDAGILLGISTGYLLDPGNPEIINDIGDNTRRYSISFLLATGTSLFLGSFVSSRVSYEPGDAILQESIGYLGAAAGFVLADLSSESSRNTQMLATSLGLIAGQSIGTYAADKRRLSSGTANTVRLLTSGGVILGLGIAFIASDENAGRTTYMTAGTLGGMIGMIYALSRAGDMEEMNNMSSWDLQFYPEGIATPVIRHQGSTVATVQPILTLQYIMD